MFFILPMVVCLLFFFLRKRERQRGFREDCPYSTLSLILLYNYLELLILITLLPPPLIGLELQTCIIMPILCHTRCQAQILMFANHHLLASISSIPSGTKSPNHKMYLLKVSCQKLSKQSKFWQKLSVHLLGCVSRFNKGQFIQGMCLKC